MIQWHQTIFSFSLNLFAQYKLFFILTKEFSLFYSSKYPTATAGKNKKCFIRAIAFRFSLSQQKFQDWIKDMFFCAAKRILMTFNWSKPFNYPLIAFQIKWLLRDVKKASLLKKIVLKNSGENHQWKFRDSKELVQNSTYFPKTNVNESWSKVSNIFRSAFISCEFKRSVLKFSFQNLEIVFKKSGLNQENVLMRPSESGFKWLEVMTVDITLFCFVFLNWKLPFKNEEFYWMWRIWSSIVIGDKISYIEFVQCHIMVCVISARIFGF